MTFPTQKTFGQFIAERVGPKWVYAKRTTDQIRSMYPGAAVILPKQQRQLAADYKREWGAEYDAPAWKALCALRAVSEQVDFCGFDSRTKLMVINAIEALTI